jgi:hypothetical protein
MTTTVRPLLFTLRPSAAIDIAGPFAAAVINSGCAGALLEATTRNEPRLAYRAAHPVRLGQRAASHVDLLRAGADARTHPMIVTAVLDGYPVHS